MVRTVEELKAGNENMSISIWLGNPLLINMHTYFRTGYSVHVLQFRYHYVDYDAFCLTVYSI